MKKFKDIMQDKSDFFQKGYLTLRLNIFLQDILPLEGSGQDNCHSLLQRHPEFHPRNQR